MKRRIHLYDHADASLTAWASMSETQQKQKTGGGGQGGESGAAEGGSSRPAAEGSCADPMVERAELTVRCKLRRG